MYFVLIVLFRIGAARQSWCDAILVTPFLQSATRNNVLPPITSAPTFRSFLNGRFINKIGIKDTSRYYLLDSHFSGTFQWMIIESYWFLKKEFKEIKWNMISDYSNYNYDILIKSPRYTGGEFMFLYPFVRRRRRWHILAHSIVFEQRFGFLGPVGPDL